MSTKGQKRKKPYRKIARTMAMPRPELKKCFAILGAGGAGMHSISTAWSEADMIGPVTSGSGTNQRIGRRIAVHYFKLKGVLAGGATGGGPVDEYYNNVRIMIYIATLNKVGVTGTPATTSAYTINTPLNSQYMTGLRKVLYDQLIGLTNFPWAANSCSPATREIDFYKRFKKPLTVTFTGDAANYNQTQIYVSCSSDSTTVPHPGFTSGYMEIAYYDF